MEGTTTNLKQSLKLRKLGVGQEIGIGDWFYENTNTEIHFCYEIYDEDFKIVHFYPLGAHSCNYVKELGPRVKAFDEAQISEMLPVHILDEINAKVKCPLCLGRTNQNEWVYYYDVTSISGSGKTHLEAKTNLLISLLEAEKAKSKPSISKPKKENYGWQDGDYQEESGWMIEGGEEAYLEALTKWNSQQIQL